MEADTMMVNERESFPKTWLIIVSCAALLAFLLKLVIALTTIGTNDVLRWETFLSTFKEYGGIGLYYRIGYFNHPPFMIHALRGMDFMASQTGIPFPFWLRLPAILADLGSVVLAWKILEPHLAGRFAPPALALMAAAPPSIMIAGFHGNTDPVMVFFLLLSVYMLDRRQWAWFAGLAFGMAMNIKVVPIIFVPVLFFYLPTLWKRITFFMLAGAAFIVGSFPYILHDPLFIARRVFGYGSLYGLWGVSRLMSLSPWVADRLALLNAMYAGVGKYIVLAAIVAVAFSMNRSDQKPPLFLQCGFVAFLFMAITPGFGVQYLAWLVPWVVGVGIWATLSYYATSGIFLFLVYTVWAKGFPWYLANADARGVGDWPHSTIWFGLLCWATVVVVLVLYFREIYPYVARSNGRSVGVEEAM